MRGVAVGAAVFVGWTIDALATSTLSSRVLISLPRKIKVCSPGVREKTLGVAACPSGPAASRHETVRSSKPLVRMISQIIFVSGSESMPTKKEFLPESGAFTMALTM